MAMDPLSWATGDVWKAILATGFLSAVFANLFGWARDALTTRSKSRANASYLALRIATVLERYAFDCADLISRNEMAQHRHGEEFPDWDASLPKTPEYPDDSDGWRALDKTLADRCLILPVNSRSRDDLIEDAWRHYPQGLEIETRRHALALGKEAWKLAEDLRNKYKIGAPERHWTPENYFARVQEDVDKRDRANAQAAIDLA